MEKHPWVPMSLEPGRVPEGVYTWNDEKNSSLCWKSKINKRALPSHCTNSAVAHYNKISQYSSYLPTYEDGTECSETSAYNVQAPWNYPKERIQHSEHGESLKSRISKSDSRLEDIIFRSFFLEVQPVRNIVQNIGFIVRGLSLPEYQSYNNKQPRKPTYIKCLSVTLQ
jgi:hypothetical protein